MSVLSRKPYRNAAAGGQARFTSGLETILYLYAGGLISLLGASGLGWLRPGRVPFVVLFLSLGLPVMIGGWKLLTVLLWGRAPRDARPERIGTKSFEEAHIPVELGDVSDLSPGDSSCGEVGGGSSCNE